MVVGLDGSQMSRAALVTVLGMVEAGARVIAVSVEETLPHYAAMRGEVDEAKIAADEFFARVGREAADVAKKYGREIEHVILRGNAAQRLVEAARRENADLLVLGQSGHSGVWESFLGTTAEKVVRHAPCSVLVVRTNGSN